MSENGKYPSDEEIQDKLKELGFVGHPDAKSTQAVIAIKEWLFDLACDWQRERDAEICEGMTMPKDAVEDGLFDFFQVEITEVLEAAAERIRNPL